MANAGRRTYLTEMISCVKQRATVLGYNIMRRMYLNTKELIFVATIFFTIFAAIQNGTQTRKLGPPVRFFPVTSVVVDYAFGNMRSLSNKINNQEISFVMYYAPWDARSIHAKKEFEETAKFYRHQVFFASINCWWTEGECRSIHNIKSFPVFAAYLSDGSGIEFKAPIVAQNMIAFLQNVIAPYIPLPNQKSLFKTLSEYQAVFVAYSNFSSSPSPYGFGQFLKSAYKMLEEDPMRQICFGLVTNQTLANELRILSSPRLFLWNTTKKYPHTNIQKDVLLKWLKNHSYGVVDWISPSGSKSTTLWDYLKNSPSLILFTPRNQVLKYSPYFEMLRYVASLYHSCQLNNDHLKFLYMIKSQPKVNHTRLKYMQKWCSRMNNQPTKISCHSFVDAIRNSRCSICLPCNSKENITECIQKSVKSMHSSKSGACTNVNGGSLYDHDILCDDGDTFPFDTSSIIDDKIREMISMSEVTFCNMFRYLPFEMNFDLNGKLSEDTVKSLSGLRCRTNKTLNVIAMDSMVYSDFASRLAINLSESIDQTAAVIISKSDEAQHVLKDVNIENIAKFIIKFTKGELDQHRPSKPGSFCQSSSENIVCIDDISADDFHSVVINNTQDVVVLFYTRWCGFCAGINHIYLSAADYFRANSNVTFIRINAEENNLPWQFTVSKFPTIMLFPGNNKGNSITFPYSMQITEPNLIEFVLSHAQDAVRQFMLIKKCTLKCLHNNFNLSLQRKSVLGPRIQSLHHKILSYKNQNSSRKKSDKCYPKTLIDEHIYYLNTIIEQKTKELEITDKLIELISSIIRENRNNDELLKLIS